MIKLPANDQAEKAAADRRAILELLSDAGGTFNDARIVRLLNDLGYVIAHDEAVSHFLWLSEQTLVVSADLGSMWVAHATRAGRDVAEGRKIVEGVSAHKAFE